MKKMFECYMVAIIFSAICCVIATIMGLIEAHDKKKQTAGKRRPLGPTAILVYTAEWIRRMTKHITAPFRRQHDHRIRFEDGVHRLSPEMMVKLEKAPHYTMDELEKVCNPEIETPRKILI